MSSNRKEKGNSKSSGKKRSTGSYRHKTRRLSIRSKVLVPTAVMVAIICCCMAFLFKMRMENDMISTGAEMAVYVGNLAEDKINGNLLEKLAPGGETSASYKALTNAMTDTIKGSSIRFMYTLYAENGKVYYGVDLDAENRQAIGSEFSEPYSLLKPVFEDGKVVKSDKIEKVNKKTSIISAYVPVYNNKMKIVGAIGCDYEAGNIVAAVNKTMQNVVMIGVVFFLIAVILFSIIISRITKNLWNVDDRIYDIVNSNGDLTQTVQIRTGDEIESIAVHSHALQ